MRIAVLGAGLQGVCIALEMAGRGVRVDLYERQTGLLTQAAVQNEGKLHLGFIYSKDPGLATAALMARGALAFEPTLRRWLGQDLDSITASRPFHYLVHRDSQVSPDALQSTYSAITALIAAQTGSSPSMFGGDPRVPVRRLTAAESERHYDPETVVAAFATPEIAIDPEALAALLRPRVLTDPGITVLTATEAIAVRPGPDAVEVDVRDAAGLRTERYDQVVNATWEDMLALDATAGVPPPATWSFRIKHFLRANGAGLAAADTPSASIVLGPFGDIVNYGDGKLFLSWYPAGRLGMSSAIRPPAWPRKLDGQAGEDLAAAILAGLATIVPDLATETAALMGSSRAQAGIIFAAGSTDIDDPASPLHNRSRIGPRRFGRYCTVDPGKWTTAPLFAVQTADLMLGIA